MRKETQKIARAFLDRDRAMATRTRTDGESVFLNETGKYYSYEHENKIAFWNHGGEKTALCFTLAGWPSVTTRERINGILELSGSNWRVKQRNGDQFLINTSTGYTVPMLDDACYYAPENDEDIPERMRGIEAITYRMMHSPD